MIWKYTSFTGHFLTKIQKYRFAHIQYIDKQCFKKVILILGVPTSCIRIDELYNWIFLNGNSQTSDRSIPCWSKKQTTHISVLVQQMNFTSMLSYKQSITGKKAQILHLLERLKSCCAEPWKEATADPECWLIILLTLYYILI